MIESRGREGVKEKGNIEFQKITSWGTPFLDFSGPDKSTVKILRVKIFENYFFDFTKKSKVRKSQNYRYIRSYKHSCRILRYLGYFSKSGKSKIEIWKKCSWDTPFLNVSGPDKSILKIPRLKILKIIFYLF